MESTEDKPSVRRELQRDWARLYKAEHYYLDLSLQAKGNLAELRGQLWPVNAEDGFPSGRVALLHDSHLDLPRGSLNDLGSFTLDVRQAASYQLLLRLDSCQISVTDVDIF